MKILPINSINFKRRLKTSEEAEYSDVLKQGKAKAANTGVLSGKSILIVPTPSLPQSPSNNTGVGNLGSEDAQKFFDFAKKYWGINEVQILPSGQYHSHAGVYLPYSGTALDLGNHMINLKDYLSEEDFKKVAAKNNVKDKVNFSNIVEFNSISEDMLKKLYNHLSPEMKQEFEAYKTEYAQLLERKSLYRAFREINHTHDYRKWNELDKNLFNEDIVSVAERKKRITEIKQLKSESIDFYKFKNFLAEKSLKKAKAELNSKGIKLNGDMLCGFAYDEVWSHPKAFLKNTKMSWSLPALDANSPDAEALLREKVNLFAKRFDGFRVDAAWTYISPNITDTKTGVKSKIFNGTKFLDIIDDEVKKVKGSDYDLNNIMHEFAADPNTEFSIYYDNELKPSVKDRVKIYTSEHMTKNWGSAKNFLDRRWNPDKFIIGSANHDTGNIEPTTEQIEALSKALNIPESKLKTKSEFLKAKFAEPLRAKNNFVFFLSALGFDNKFQHLSDRSLDWTAKIPENYEEVYINALSKGTAYNPMDALEKQFKAQGLDKNEPELFKKIVKYRKILEEKEGAAPSWKKFAIGAACIGLVLLGFGIAIYKKNHSSK